MNKESAHTSQDYDRKHNQDHTSSNPRADKTNHPGENGKTDISSAEDKRRSARHEHTNHFSNRSSDHNR